MSISTECPATEQEPPLETPLEQILSQDTPKPIKRYNRRITEQDMDAMAKLIAERLTETESCETLGINYESWRTWKCKAKNEPRFSNVLNRLKAAKIAACMKGIEKAGVKDWRALRERLSLLDRERFSDRVQAPVNTAQIDAYAQLGLDVAKLLGQAYAQHQQAKAVVDVQEVKQLPEPSNDK